MGYLQSCKAISTTQIRLKEEETQVRLKEEENFQACYTKGLLSLLAMQDC